MDHLAYLITIPMGRYMGEKFICSCGAEAALGELVRGTASPERAMFGGKPPCGAILRLVRTDYGWIR